MRRPRRGTWRTLVVLLGILALVAAACGDGDGEPAEDDTAAETTAPDETDTDAAADVDFDVGVTEEPCPDAVNPDNGCIYLGTLSDLTVGPFATFGEQIVQGQEAFWQRVNDEGGIAGFDVAMGDHIEDTEYNPEQHAQSYQQISGEVAALTQTLGTPPTLAIIDAMRADDMVGAVLTWWSGWEFDEAGGDVILQSGSNYCIDAMNGVEWAQGEYDVGSVMTVYFPGDYGGDANSGVSVAAQELGLELLTQYEQVPTAAGGETSGAVEAILSNSPDLVFLTVGPTETAEIVGGAAAQGFQGRFIVSHPGYAGQLLESPAGEAILGLLNVVGPHANFGGDSDAHRAMQEAIGEGETPGNDGWTFGWIAAYPVKAVLEQAAENGDLTRAGIRAAVEEVTVDYEGALPDKSYGGEPNETVVRTTTLSQPDTEGTLGLTTLEPRLEGEVAANYEFDGPCQPIG